MSRARLFDAMTMTNLVSQEYYTTEKADVYDIVYNRDDEILTVLQPWGNYTYFVPLKINLTGNQYLTCPAYDTDALTHHYTSMDTVSSVHYLATGRGRLAQRMGFLFYLNALPTTSCFPYTILKVVQTPNTTLNLLFPGGSIISSPIINYTIQNTVSTKTDTPECVSD